MWGQWTLILPWQGSIYIFPNRVFPKWNGNSVNSANSENIRNHWSMNWGQLKDPLCYLCLAGVVIASWFLTKEVAGRNTLVAKIFDRFCSFYRIQLGKTRLMNQTISYIWWTEAWTIIFFDTKMILWGNFSNWWLNISPKNNRRGSNTEIDVWSHRKSAFNRK